MHEAPRELSAHRGIGIASDQVEPMKPAEDNCKKQC